MTTQTKTRAAAAILALVLFMSAQAQDNSYRLVDSKRVYICTMCSTKDTFQTAKDACIHFAEKHVKDGYKYKSDQVTENGAVKCVCTKSGSPDNDQQGIIMGVVICPDLATEVIDQTHFLQKKCECPTPGYVALDNKCVQDTCTMASMDPETLKLKITERLQQIVNEENQAFAANPARVYDPAVVGPTPLFSQKEIDYFGKTFGFKKVVSDSDPADTSYAYAESSWNIIYGHAVERLAAKRVEKDMCLKQLLQYIKNVDQTKEGGQPDFKGNDGASNYDITTPGSAEKKKQTENKKDWIFITYTRLIEIDEKGGHKPAKQRPPLTQPGRPTRRN